MSNNARLNRFQYNGYTQEIISALQRRGKLDRLEWFFSGKFQGVYDPETNESTFTIPLDGLKIIDYCQLFHLYDPNNELRVFVKLLHDGFQSYTSQGTSSNTTGTGYMAGAIGDTVIVRVVYSSGSFPPFDFVKINMHGFSLRSDGLDWNDADPLPANDFNQTDFNPSDFG